MSFNVLRRDTYAFLPACLALLPFGLLAFPCKYFCNENFQFIFACGGLQQFSTNIFQGARGVFNFRLDAKNRNANKTKSNAKTRNITAKKVQINKYDKYTRIVQNMLLSLSLSLSFSFFIVMRRIKSGDLSSAYVEN